LRCDTDAKSPETEALWREGFRRRSVESHGILFDQFTCSQIRAQRGGRSKNGGLPARI
jgi:hypothetical protein